MFSRYAIAAAALLVLPTLADAQRKTRGEKEANWDAIDKNVVPTIKVSKGDIENFSAIKIIVDKKKDLKLSDDQLAKFKDLAKQEEGANEPFYKQVDSLKLAMRKRPGEDDDQERARTSIAREELLSIIKQIRANYDSTYQVCLPWLDETQKKSAAELVQKERAGAEEDLRSKLGGRGGGSRRP